MQCINDNITQCKHSLWFVIEQGLVLRPLLQHGSSKLGQMYLSHHLLMHLIDGHNIIIAVIFFDVVFIYIPCSNLQILK